MAGTFSQQLRYHPNGRALLRVIDAEAVILNLDSGQYYGLNPVGTRAWQLLEAAPGFSELCQSLRSEFDAPTDVLAADIAALMQELLDAGLVMPAKEERGALSSPSV